MQFLTNLFSKKCAECGSKIQGESFLSAATGLARVGGSRRYVCRTCHEEESKQLAMEAERASQERTRRQREAAAAQLVEERRKEEELRKRQHDEEERKVQEQRDRAKRREDELRRKQDRERELAAMSVTALKSGVGNPIQREMLDNGEEECLIQLAKLKSSGNAQAEKEIALIVEGATARLLDIAEFSRHHGYARQQIAAMVVGLAGDRSAIPSLERARALQDTYAGSSQYSNQTSTKRLVQTEIDKAITRLGASARRTN